MTSKSEKYRWLKWLPDPIKREDLMVKQVGSGDEVHALSVHPVTLVVDEQPWIFVSNGSAMLLVRDTIDWRAASDRQQEIIRGFLGLQVKGKTWPLAHLRRWLGKGWAGEVPCDRCNGDWVKNCPSCFGMGQRQGGCERCGASHDCNCRACNGNGTIFCPGCTGGLEFEKRPGHVNGVVFDRAMLARFLVGVEVGPKTKVKVMATGRANPVVVEPQDKSWRAVIMPLREPESAQVPELS